MMLNIDVLMKQKLINKEWQAYSFSSFFILDVTT